MRKKKNNLTLTMDLKFEKCRYKKKGGKRIRRLADLGHIPSQAVLEINKVLAGKEGDLNVIVFREKAYVSEHKKNYNQVWHYYTGENAYDLNGVNPLELLGKLAQVFYEGSHHCPRNRKAAFVLYKTVFKHFLAMYYSMIGYDPEQDPEPDPKPDPEQDNSSSEELEDRKKPIGFNA